MKTNTITLKVICDELKLDSSKNPRTRGGLMVCCRG